MVVGGGKLLEHDIVFNDVKLTATVDTGAYVSVINEEIVDAMGWEIDSPSIPLVGANGNPLESKGRVNVELILTINNTSKKVQHKLSVVKNLTTAMLLGLELLRAFRVKIDVINSKLEFTRKDIESGIRIINSENIPSRSQAVIKARVNCIKPIMSVPFVMNSGLLVANTISQPKGNMTPVAVLNPTRHEIQLETGLQIASYEEIDDSETDLDHSSKTIESNIINKVMKVAHL